ncbi:S8 family serine peptidase [Candidatus Sumerlaeota bacterium]|nr:S8 family serine peptidase [Candidatus Sumerlaeota bacterium]
MNPRTALRRQSVWVASILVGATAVCVWAQTGGEGDNPPRPTAAIQIMGKMPMPPQTMSETLMPRVSASSKLAPSLDADYEGSKAVWVLFGDKNVASPQGRTLARSDADRRVSARAHERRAMRGRDAQRADTELDFPVSPDYIAAVRDTGLRIRTTSRWLNAVSAEATSAQVRAAARLPFVRRIEPIPPSRRVEPEETVPPPPGPPPQKSPAEADALSYGSSLAQLVQIDAVAAHGLGYDGSGVIVGLLDTGFYYRHECLTSRTLLAQHDFVFGDGDVEYDSSNPSDYSDSHGTSVWSLLGGLKDGSLVGVAYNASFLLAKTEDTRSETPVEEDYWVAGIEWMEAQGVDVVNSSLSYPSFYTYSQLDGSTAKTTLAADQAALLGVVVCNAAGNAGPDPGSIGPPADAFRVVSAGGVNSDGSNWSLSSRGPTYDGRIKPEVCARGSGAFVASATRPGTSYGYGSGTSFASPLVAGAAALVVQAHPDWTPDVVRDALMLTADRHDTPDNTFGWGIVDVVAAIAYEPPASARAWPLYR